MRAFAAVVIALSAVAMTFDMLSVRVSVKRPVKAYVQLARRNVAPEALVQSRYRPPDSGRALPSLRSLRWQGHGDRLACRPQCCHSEQGSDKCVGRAWIRLINRRACKWTQDHAQTVRSSDGAGCRSLLVRTHGIGSQCRRDHAQRCRLQAGSHQAGQADLDEVIWSFIVGRSRDLNGLQGRFC